MIKIVHKNKKKIVFDKKKLNNYKTCTLFLFFQKKTFFKDD